MTIAKIMIVEDGIIIATDIKVRLQHMNYSVTSIVNKGREAIEKAIVDFPDLIIMDIRLKRGK